MSDIRLPRVIARELMMVVSSLRTVGGERTVWLDPYGRLWHGTPRQELPNPRWRTVGTFRRPTLDAITTATLSLLRSANTISSRAAA